MLELSHISKSFPGMKALSDVTLAVAAGEVHALCGENGAGKSTLMNIIAGNLVADEGEIRWNGEPVVFRQPQDAFARGIAIVYQHLSLVGSLSVAENIYANSQPASRAGLIDFQVLHNETRVLLASLGIDIRPDEKVSRLPAASMQMVEIAKALARKPKLLILDEPTASLTDREARRLFGIINELKKNGVAVIYISHRLPEIFGLSDRITILKDGVNQGTLPAASLTPDALIQKMVGRDVLQVRRTGRAARSEVLLAVKNLTGRKFSGISFEMRAGEIVGLAGLVGAGRSEIARALFGAEPATGAILIRGKEVQIAHPADAMANGIAYVPEDRKALGLFPDMSVSANIAVTSLANAGGASLTDSVGAVEEARRYAKELRLAARGVDQRVNTLSGGNQQKVVLAKWLRTRPDLLIVDEPTHGIDVGAKYEIYEMLLRLADEGKGILLISSELPEVLALCDRIIVLKNGTIAGELPAAEADEEKIISLAS